MKFINRDLLKVDHLYTYHFPPQYFTDLETGTGKLDSSFQTITQNKNIESPDKRLWGLPISCWPKSGSVPQALTNKAQSWINLYLFLSQIKVPRVNVGLSRKWLKEVLARYPAKPRQNEPPYRCFWHWDFLSIYITKQLSEFGALCIVISKIVGDKVYLLPHSSSNLWWMWNCIHHFSILRYFKKSEMICEKT